VPAWDTVKVLLLQWSLRERAILALMAYGGLRRGDVAALDVGDVAPDFGPRRVMGKGGHVAVAAAPAAFRVRVWQLTSWGYEPKGGVTAAGGRSCCLSSRRCPQSFLLGRLA
jgi:site-specific recombinase XerC